MELRQYLAVLAKHRLLIATICLSAAGAALVASRLATPVFQASTTILVEEQASLENTFLQAMQLGQPAVADCAEMLRSRSLLQSAASRYRLIPEDDPAALERLRHSVMVQPVAGTRSIRLVVESTRPAAARDLANGLIQELIARNQVQSSTEARGARLFVGSQIEIASGRLARAEEELRQYKKTHRVFAPESEAQAVLAQATQLETRRAETEVALGEAEIRLDQIRRQLAGQPVTVVSATTIGANPLVQELKTRLTGLEVELAEAREEYTDRHPAVLALVSRVDEVKRQMQREAERIVTAETETLNPVHQELAMEEGRLQVEQLALDVRRTTLNNLLREVEERLAQLPDEEIQLAGLVRNAKVTEQIYVMLRQKYEELRIAEAMKSGNVRIIDEAVIPERPVRPRILLNIALAAFLGLLIGVGLAFFLDYLDTTIHSPEDVEENLGLPVLGQIPIHVNGRSPQGRGKTV